VRLADAAGRTRDLKDLAAGRVTVVAFTSRFCAPALEDMPRLAAVRTRLERAGVRVLVVVEEAGPSPALAAALAKAGLSGPVHFDTRHEASRAFNQWGTPNYFALDGDGRVRFEVTSSAEDVLAEAEALLAADRAG
jgi:peroxiredoxin